MTNEDEILKQIQRELDKHMQEINTAPREEMDGLSPTDMHHLLHRTFEQESPVKFKASIGGEVLSDIPFLTVLVYYLNTIEEAKEIKLTQRGNLPVKLCKELYALGIIQERSFRLGGSKLTKEQDSSFLQNIKHLADLSGLTKKRKNKVSLTNTGRKLLPPNKREELFKTVFIANFRKINLGYLDGYANEIDFNTVFGFTIYLLLRYGKEDRLSFFYAEKNYMAFPQMLHFFDDSWSTVEQQFESCYECRVFERFLYYYGLIDIQRGQSIFSKTESIKTTPLFNHIFKLDTDAFRFSKSPFMA